MPNYRGGGDDALGGAVNAGSVTTPAPNGTTLAPNAGNGTTPAPNNAGSTGGRLKRRKSRKSRKPRKSRKQRKSYRRR